MLTENRMRGRRNRAVGKQCEAIVVRHLEMLGFRMPEVVHTPWRIQRALRNGRSVIVGATPEEKVSGDVRAVGPGGRSVLVETKHREERLVFSDLEQHQRDALTEHAAAGGLSLVGWVVLEPRVACWVMPWDALIATGFRARSSLTPIQASLLAIHPAYPTQGTR